MREAQQALKQQGFDAGPIDGQMGPKTEAALRKFQQSKQLPASGQLDRQTLAALGMQGGSSGSTSSSQNGSSMSLQSGSSSPPSSSSRYK